MPAARSSRLARPRAPAGRRNIRQRRPRRRPRLWAKAGMRSWSDHADEAVDVPFRVVEIGRNANVAFAQAHDHIFFAQPLIKLGRLLAAARSEAAIGPALRGVERAGGNAAIFGKTLEH